MSDEKVSPWIEQTVPLQDRFKLEQKIAEIEKNTRGEVVVMIAKKSHPWSHVPFLVFMILLFLISLLDIAGLLLTPGLNPYILVALSLVVCLALTSILIRFEFVHRLFVSLEDRTRGTEIRAELEFYRKGLQKTNDSTGVLLYVSLLEHRAIILGDKSIADRLPPETWEVLLRELTTELRNGNLVQGLVQTLDKVGSLLAQHFPSRGPDTNELSNHLLFIEE